MSSCPRSPSWWRGCAEPGPGSCVRPLLATPRCPLGLSSPLWGKRPQSGCERWQGRRGSSGGGPSSHPLPSIPTAPPPSPHRDHEDFTWTPWFRAAGSRGAEGHSREGDRGARGVQTSLPRAMGSPARPGAPGHRMRTGDLSAVNCPRVFNLFLHFPRASHVAWA